MASELCACSLPQVWYEAAEFGPAPLLSDPDSPLLPVINTARPVGWAADAAPTAPDGFIVTRYGEGLSHPRWLYVLPNGDVLVAETSSRPASGDGLMSWIKNQVQRGAGALHDSADRITLLRDSNGDGAVDVRNVFAHGLNQPFGMALIGDDFYVANTDALVRFQYSTGARRLNGAGEEVLALPHRDGDNGHWTRNLAVSPDGSKIYVAVGSASNIADYGMEAEEGRAAIWEYDLASGEARVFAGGLRNPVGMDFEPETGALWVSVNERDMLGDQLAPDYMTSVRDGGFYGWPYSYFGAHVDERVSPQDAELVARAIAPDFALGAHTASLGLEFYSGEAFPARYRGGAFVGQHGSWNRRDPSGYKVVFAPFEAGAPQGEIEDFLTGFLNARGEAQGRPVGVVTDGAGALLVADDVGDIVWRVAYAPS
jgi:glucose/arabinose dehydrogenase